jgi:hypothetical protein
MMRVVSVLRLECVGKARGQQPQDSISGPKVSRRNTFVNAKQKKKKQYRAALVNYMFFCVGRILKANKRTWYDVITWEEEGQVAKQAEKETE